MVFLAEVFLAGVFFVTFFAVVDFDLMLDFAVLLTDSSEALFALVLDVALAERATVLFEFAAFAPGLLLGVLGLGVLLLEVDVRDVVVREVEVLVIV